MKKLYQLRNFGAGINENLDAAASDLTNLNVQVDGSLVTRSGLDFGGNGIETLSLTANSTFGTTGPMSGLLQSFFLAGRLFFQTNAGLFYRSLSATYYVENKTDVASTTLYAAADNAYFANKYHVVEANQERAFIANGKHQFWIDLTGNYPILYNWGMDAPNFTSSDITLSTTGGFVEAGFYAYAIEYENIYGGLSPLSPRVIVEHTGESNRNQADIDTTIPHSITATKNQIKYINFYRTEKQEPIPTDSFTEIEGTLAQNAPLKLWHQLDVVTMINAGTPSSYSIYDTARSIGLSKIAVTEFCSKPPASLDNITLYAGRIWGSMKQNEPATLPVDGDMVCFSAIDETAAPLYDIFPIVKQTVISDDVVTASPPLPHQIKVRDVVSSIGKSRNYLAVFGAASIQLVKGQGIIEGMYGLKTPNTDLDISDYMGSIGAKEFCVSEMNGNLYFYNDTDKRVYRLDNNAQLNWISAPIQSTLNAIESDDVKNLVADDGMAYLLVTDADRRSKIYAFEEARKIWTHYDLGLVNLTGLTVNVLENSYVSRGNSEFASPSSTTYVTGSPGIYSLGENNSGANVHYRLFDESATQDNSANIVTSITSSEFVFAKPTRIDGVRLLLENTTNQAVVITSIEVDGDANAVKIPSTGTYTISRTNNYTIRCFATGYRFKVKVQLSGVHTIHGLEIQFRSR
tara:strand:- start:1032 stop:3095 length:2064 start_codon:yes stop_codon:yes gene_type:complete